MDRNRHLVGTDFSLLQMKELQETIWLDGSPTTMYSFSIVDFPSRAPIPTKYSLAFSVGLAYAAIDLSYSAWKASKIHAVYKLLACISKALSKCVKNREMFRSHLRH
ncbi:hypothetical protein ACP70R_043950 [Stipagrostis hirtigluma subsp. patula]